MEVLEWKSCCLVGSCPKRLHDAETVVSLIGQRTTDVMAATPTAENNTKPSNLHYYIIYNRIYQPQKK